MTEFLGAAFMMTAAVLFCVFLKRIMGKKPDTAVYIIFSCLFVSNPIISFDFIYYLHNGAGLGYVLTALALIYYHDSLVREGKSKIKALAISLLFIWIAAGCYESFIVLFILGVLVTLFFYIGKQKSSDKKYDRKKTGSLFIIANLALGAGIVVCTMILRSVIQALLIAVLYTRRIQ